MGSEETTRIRAACVDDAAGIATVQLGGWQSAYRGILPHAFLDGLSLEAWTERGRRFLRSAPRPGMASFVAERDGRIVGVVVTGPTRDEDAWPRESEVYAIYAEPERIGTGIGRALLAHALADAVARGFENASLWVFEANARARRFYEKAGFALDDSPAGRKTKTFGTPPLTASAPEVRYRRAIGATAPGRAS